MQNHWRARFVTTIVGAAAVLLAGMATHAAATTVHVTFFKGRHAVEGFGNLFYEGERYRLQIEGLALSALKFSRLDLTGSVENIHAASEILGTFGAADPGQSTVVDNNKSVRIKNKNDVIIDVHSVNLGKLSLDLAGMTVTSRGWGPDAKERSRH